MGCFVDILFDSKVVKNIVLQCNWWVYVLNTRKLIYRMESECSNWDAKDGRIKI